MQTYCRTQAKRLVALLILTALAASVGLAQKPAAPTANQGTPATLAKTASSAPGERVVLRVGTQEVTESDFEFVVENFGPQLQQTIAFQGRRPIGEQYAMMLLLSQRATSRHVDASPEFRRRMDMQKIEWLVQAEMDYLESQVQVTPEQVSQFYAANWWQFEEVQVRDILVRTRPEGSGSDVPGLTPEEARKLAAVIRQAVVAGRDFKEVAQEYAGSEDVFVGQEPRSFRRGQLLPGVENAVFPLKAGEFTPPVDTAQAIAVFQKMGSRVPELSEVREEAEVMIRRQKVQNTLAELRQKATIWMDEAFFSASAPSSRVPVLTTVPTTPPPQR